MLLPLAGDCCTAREMVIIIMINIIKRFYENLSEARISSLIISIILRDI